MNTKKAIEFLERYKCLDLDNINGVVDLLKHGEKYEAMWEEFRDNRPRRIGTYWEKYINKLEQKYFPKEIIDEVVKGITEQIEEGAEIARKECENQ